MAHTWLMVYALMPTQGNGGKRDSVEVASKAEVLWRDGDSHLHEFGSFSEIWVPQKMALTSCFFFTSLVFQHVARCASTMGSPLLIVR